MSIIKKIIGTAVAFNLIFCLCTDSVSRAPFEPLPYGSDIAPITQINSGMEILGGTIGRTSVAIGFRFISDKSGMTDIIVKAGITDSTFCHQAILNKPPKTFQADLPNVYEIKNLTPGTEYFVTFIRNDQINEWKLKFTFTTKT